jgi:general secretion pathway protein D
MSALPARAYLTPAVLLLGLLGLGAAPPQAPCPHRVGLVQRVYAVADLIVPLESAAPAVKAGAGLAPRPPCQSPVTLEDNLIRLITRSVEPVSWSDSGGAGTIDYYPLGMALVVRQTPAAHEQVADLLDALRRLFDVEVAVELRFVSVSDACLGRLGLKMPAEDAREAHALLDARELHSFFEAVQGDPGTSVTQAPKVTVANGQRAALQISERQAHVTGGAVTPRPCDEAPVTGVRLAVRPAVTPDRRSVLLSLRADLSDFDPVEPVAASWSTLGLAPVAVIPYLQVPRVRTLSVERTLKVPDGSTVVLYAGSRPRQTRAECGPPVLSKIAYVNRLFKNVCYGQETEHVLVLATPRVVVAPEEERSAGTEAPKGEEVPGGAD